MASAGFESKSSSGMAVGVVGSLVRGVVAVFIVVVVGGGGRSVVVVKIGGWLVEYGGS